MAGEAFNINSPKQLGAILFEKLGIPPVKKTKTGYSTNAEVLDKLRYFYPIVDEILAYRQYTKLKSTYADGLLKEIRTGRPHPHQFPDDGYGDGPLVLYRTESAEHSHPDGAGQ